MSVVTLYPAIALATVINFFSFYIMWRGHKEEMRRGDPPLWLIFFMLAYIGSVGGYSYMQGRDSVETFLDLVMTGILGQAMGALIIFGIYNALSMKRHEPIQTRMFAYLVAFGLLGLMASGLFLDLPSD